MRMFSGVAVGKYGDEEGRTMGPHVPAISQQSHGTVEHSCGDFNHHGDKGQDQNLERPFFTVFMGDGKIMMMFEVLQGIWVCLGSGTVPGGSGEQLSIITRSSIIIHVLGRCHQIGFAVYANRSFRPKALRLDINARDNRGVGGKGSRGLPSVTSRQISMSSSQVRRYRNPKRYLQGMYQISDLYAAFVFSFGEKWVLCVKSVS